MITELSCQERDALLQAAADRLSEHFDTVQIIATSMLDKGATQMNARGAGNMYARLASARTFVENDHIESQAWEMARQMKKEEE